jgi:hypothetical protein
MSPELLALAAALIVGGLFVLLVAAIMRIGGH